MLRLDVYRSSPNYELNSHTVLCGIFHNCLCRRWWNGISGSFRYNHTERQAEHQASTLAAAAASPMQVYGDASLDAPNGSQIHWINLTLHLTLTLDATLDARCGLGFNLPFDCDIGWNPLLVEFHLKRSMSSENLASSFKPDISGSTESTAAGTSMQGDLFTAGSFPTGIPTGIIDQLQFYCHSAIG